MTYKFLRGADIGFIKRVYPLFFMSRLILGGASLGGMDFGSAENLISVALDAGVTTIDTAPIYVNSEVRIGEYLRKNKSGDLKISTRWAFQPSLT